MLFLAIGLLRQSRWFVNLRWCPIFIRVITGLKTIFIIICPASNFNQTLMQGLSAKGSISNIHVCPSWYGTVTGEPPIQVKFDLLGIYIESSRVLIPCLALAGTLTKKVLPNIPIRPCSSPNYLYRNNISLLKVFKMTKKGLTCPARSPWCPKRNPALQSR